MAVSFSTLVTRMTSGTPATIATAIGSGTTAAEVSGLMDLLSTLSKRNDLSIPPLLLGDQTKTQLIPG